MCQSSADQEVKETDEKPVIIARGVCSHWRSMIPVDSWFGRLAPLWSWWLAGRLDTLLVKPADSREHPRTTRHGALPAKWKATSLRFPRMCKLETSCVFPANIQVTIVRHQQCHAHTHRLSGIRHQKVQPFPSAEDITGSVIPWALILSNSPSRVSSEIASLVPAVPWRCLLCHQELRSIPCFADLLMETRVFQEPSEVHG